MENIKSFINIDQNSKVPPLIKGCVVYEDEIDKVNILYEHLTEQTKFIDSNSQLPETNLTNHNISETYQITPDEGEAHLKKSWSMKCSWTGLNQQRFTKKILAFPSSNPLCDIQLFSSEKFSTKIVAKKKT